MTISYFSHDSNARNSKKLLRLRKKHGAAGYGVYFMLIERLTEEPNFTSDLDYDMLAYDLHVKRDLIRSVVENFELFEIIEGQGSTVNKLKFRSSGLMERMELRAIRSAAGRRGAANRWNNGGSGSPQSGFQEEELQMSEPKPQHGKSMANEDFANGKSMANAPVANGIKENNNIENNKNNPFFYVFPFFDGKDLAVLAYLVLVKNVCNAEQELDKLIAYNTLEKGKDWNQMNVKERIAAATLWSPRSKKLKYTDGYRNLWIQLVELMAHQIPVDCELLYAALNDKCKEGYVGTYDEHRTYVFDVAPIVRNWMEANSDKIRDMVKKFRDELNCSSVGYDVTLEENPFGNATK